MYFDDIANSIAKTRAKRLARGNVFIQRGLFDTALEWEEKRKKHISNIKFLSNFIKHHKQTK